MTKTAKEAIDTMISLIFDVDPDEFTDGTKERYDNCLKELEAIMQGVIGQDDDLDEARKLEQVFRDDINGTRHALDSDAVLKAIAVNYRLSKQRHRLSEALYGRDTS